MAKIRRIVLLLCAAASILPAASAQAERGRKAMTLAVTDTAAPVLRDLLPRFKENSGIQVDLAVRPARDAAALARAGKVDAVMTDDPEGEEALIRNRDAVKRLNVMYIELIVVGPATDPARIAGMASVVHAFAAIARTQSTFLSRADGSGMHRLERGIWRETGFADLPGRNRWYVESRGNMADTLQAAAKRNGYTLSDRASWLQFAARRQLMVMVADDPRLQQLLAITLVNPAKHKAAQAEHAETLANWLVTRDIQLAIGRFALNGEQPYVPHFGLSQK